MPQKTQDKDDDDDDDDALSPRTCCVHTSHLDPTKLAWPSLLSLTGNKVGKSVFLSLCMCTIACRLRSENVPLPKMGEGGEGVT